MASREFIVDGVKFQQRNLGAEDSLRGFNMLVKALGSAATSFQDLKGLDEDALGALVTQALGALDCLPAFSSLMTNTCSVDLSSIATPGAVGAGSWQPMASVKEQIFGGGKVARHISWVVQAVVWEYSSFLAESGRAPLKEMGSALKSLTTSIQSSGA